MDTQDVLAHSRRVLSESCSASIVAGKWATDEQVRRALDDWEQSESELRTRLTGEEYIRTVFQHSANRLRNRIEVLNCEQKARAKELTDLREAVHQARELRIRLSATQQSLYDKSEAQNARIQTLEQQVADRDSRIRKLALTTLDLVALQEENQALRASIDAIGITHAAVLRERDRLLKENACRPQCTPPQKPSTPRRPHIPAKKPPHCAICRRPLKSASTVYERH